VAWKADGVPAAAIGVLWATGVAAEIVFFALSPRLMKAWSPAHLLALGGAVSVVRWVALAAAPPLPVLFGLQLLHAFSFGATYLGFLRFATDAAPERFAATAQAVNSALSGGLVLAGAVYASGFAFSLFGAGGFAVMALPAALGAGAALGLVHRDRSRS
jgi:PPP family 3-phenylpropionic acid transporter